MSEAFEDRDGRAGGATMLQPVILRLTLNAAAFRPPGRAVHELIEWRS